MFQYIPLPNTELPEFVSNIAEAIIKHDGMQAKMAEEVWSADSEIFESKYARDLQLLSNGKKISNDPSTWVCEMSGATENLWLNLSTGYIGGGRKNWDGRRQWRSLAALRGHRQPLSSLCETWDHYCPRG